MEVVDIKANLLKIQNEIKEQEIKTGRQEGSVKLLAVSKFHPAQSVIDSIETGQYLFGENRVQEAYTKFTPLIAINPNIELHIIGTLQKNKVTHAVLIASCIESVDRLEIINELEKQCIKINKQIHILFEYHTGEESKAGFTSFDSLLEAITYCISGNTPHIIPDGFMTMAPLTTDESKIHNSFKILRETAEKIKKIFPQLLLPVLSMGMSDDFKIAIEEGSTEVRIGSAIFGKREYVLK
jgi:PLP dependent protein